MSKETDEIASLKRQLASVRREVAAGNEATKVDEGGILERLRGLKVEEVELASIGAAIAIGLVAGVALAMKPHYLAIPAAVELYLLVRRGWRATSAALTRRMRSGWRTPGRSRSARPTSAATVARVTTARNAVAGSAST